MTNVYFPEDIERYVSGLLIQETRTVIASGTTNYDFIDGTITTALALVTMVGGDFANVIYLVSKNTNEKEVYELIEKRVQLIGE